jgi:hypothetical protein
MLGHPKSTPGSGPQLAPLRCDYLPSRASTRPELHLDQPGGELPTSRRGWIEQPSRGRKQPRKRSLWGRPRERWFRRVRKPVRGHSSRSLDFRRKKGRGRVQSVSRRGLQCLGGSGERGYALAARDRRVCAGLPPFAAPSGSVLRPGCCGGKEERVSMTSGKMESTAETDPRLLLIAIVAPANISL